MGWQIAEMKIGEKITLLREKAGWSQGELARRTGIFFTRFSKWEAGKGEPDWSQASAIATAFGVSVQYLIDDLQDDPGGESERRVWSLVREIGFEEAARRLQDASRTPAQEVAFESFEKSGSDDPSQPGADPKPR